MLKQFTFDRFTHISDDGKETRCGHDCSEWRTLVQVEDSYRKEDCPTCGTPEAFQAERNTIAALRREDAIIEATIRRDRQNMLKRRVEASNVVEDKLRAMLVAAGIKCSRVVHGHISTEFGATLVEDGIDFQITLKVTF